MRVVKNRREWGELIGVSRRVKRFIKFAMVLIRVESRGKRANV